MNISKILTPQVRTFIYGVTASLLLVATAKGWVSDDLAKSINDNLPTIIGAVASILAAANVNRPSKPVEAPATPVIVADIAPVSIGIAQAAAVEEKA